MFRRLAVLLALVGAGWYLYTRMLKGQAYEVGDTADLRPDDQRGGLAERVSQAASGAAATAVRAAQAPVQAVRSAVGAVPAQPPEGERVVTPEGSADEDAATEIASGYAPADARREPPPTPDAYRPAAEASPSATIAPRREAGATVPQEGRPEDQAQSATDEAAVGADAEPERTIKGNVRAGGDKIYHLPGDPAYERTNADEWFATVGEAEAAGFRRAGRPRQE